METTDSTPELLIANRNRDQTLACALLCLTLALAMVSSNLAPDRKTEFALKEASGQRVILEQNKAVLQANQLELAADMVALEAAKKAQHQASR